ncbi:MAG: Fic family protein [Bacteroidota bacterium]
MSGFIYQKRDWPNFLWNNERLITVLGKVRNLQGKIIGSMESLGFELRSEATLEALTLEILTTNEIEGEILNPEQVRSSVARRLGMDIAGLVPSDRNVEGVVDMMMDAVGKYNEPLTEERLFDWHYALFPTGRSGMYTLIVGNWRDDSTGPLQVVSGPMGREQVHFQAPTATAIGPEMSAFINWVNNEKTIDPVIKAGIAHLWFVTIHPFEDGNGRIARAITDMLLTRADGVSQRYYSMSSQIRIEREAYYRQLEFSQKGSLDITDWLEWFLSCLLNALIASSSLLSKVISKHTFWTKWAKTPMNDRQSLMLNKLLDGFKGKLTTSKWAKIAKCSNDTALRDIQDLVKKGILAKEEAGGRSTSYILREID